MDHHKNLYNPFVRSAQQKMWQESLTLGACVFVFLLIYTSAHDQSFTSLQVSTSLGGTASLLIGFSFALSGFCYYWDFLDKKLAYRKYIGLVGYWSALSYSLTLLFLEPERYIFTFFDHIYEWEVLLGVTAMAIFTSMAIISTNRMMRLLRPQKWRYGLRLGYVAYALLIIRAYILEKDLWLQWATTPDSLPPPRLVLSIFAILVILFRISMIVSQYRKKLWRHLQPTTSVVSPPQ